MEFFTQLDKWQALFWAIGVIASLLLLYQDLRQRRVHILLLIGLCAAGTAFRLQQPWPILLQENAANLIFITTILAIAYAYLRIRHKSPRAFSNQIGLGDILFFGAAIPWFTPIQYILFFISGILITLTATLTLHLLRKIPKDWPIPLAGLLAAYWILYVPVAQTLESWTLATIHW